MKSAKPVHLFELFSIIVVALLAFASCSNAAGSSGSSGGGAAEAFDADSVLVEWDSSFGAFVTFPSEKLEDAESREIEGDDNFFVKYQWQKSDTGNDGTWENVTDIQANNYIYYPSGEEIGEFLRVKVDWMYEGYEQASLLSNAFEIQNHLDCSGLECEYVLAGSPVDAGELKGYVSDIYGHCYLLENCNVAVKEDSNPLFSDDILFEVSKDGMSEEIFIFVPVKGKLTAAPSLSTDKPNISSGKVKFAAPRGDLEYSTDDGTSWHDLDADEFAAAVGNEIKVRTKAIGEEDWYGYVKESDPKTVMVTDANVGTASDAGGSVGIDFKHLELTLTPTTEGSLHKVTAVLSNDDAFKDWYGANASYSWYVDGSEIVTSDSANSIYYDNNGKTLVLNKEKLNGVYQIFCLVSFKVSDECEAPGNVGQQTSVDLR